MTELFPDLPAALRKRTDSRKSLHAFMRKHGIESNHGCDPWIAISIPETKKLLKGEDDPLPGTIGGLICNYGRLIEEAGMIGEGETEADAVRSLCEKLKITITITL